jgi:hypothetical protein
MKSKKKNKFSTLSATESQKIRKVAEVVYNQVVSELKSKHGINNGQQLIDDARAMIAKYSK